MPFTRHPLDYQINRVLLLVGMFLQTYLPLFPPIEDPKVRRAFERQLSDILGLDAYIEKELIRSYHFKWERRRKKLKTIRIVPHDRVRRTPGISRVKELFFPS